MKVFIKWVVISCAFFILNSCGENKPKRPKPPKPLNTSAPTQRGTPNDCKQKNVSDKNIDCFYVLPNIKDGQTFTGTYKDTETTQTKGITVGKGVWICQKGKWRQLYRPHLCLTCLPKRNLEQCQAELERLLKKPVL